MDRTMAELAHPTNPRVTIPIIMTGYWIRE
jgi:hypothetical protein